MNRGYGLGRISVPDDRDNKFPMSVALTDASQYVPRAMFWRIGPILDQGKTSHCVGYAWRQWLTSHPLPTKDGPLPHEIYHEAQEIDEWPGVEPDYFGTSVRAGAKVLERRGHLAQYLWAFDMPTVRHFVLTRGPVIFGTNWYKSMFAPKHGLVKPDGTIEGGHAYLCTGYTSATGMFRFVNSWGEDWGQDGRFWMREDSVALLLSQGGEACAAVETKVIQTTEEA